MSLYKCTKCGTEITEFDEKCPVCGCPVDVPASVLSNDEKKKFLPKKLIILLVVVAVIGVTGFSLTTELRKYNRAINLYEKQKFKEAQTLFTELDDYKDTGTWCDKTKYKIAMQYKDNKEYQKAIAEFEQIFEYEDSSEQIVDCTYEDAKNLLEKGANKNTYYTFLELGDYKDSKELAKKTINNCKEGLYQDAITNYETGYYQDALDLFCNFIDYEKSESYIQKCKIMLNFQGVYESSLTKKDYLLLDGNMLYVYDFDSWEERGVSKKIIKVALEYYDGMFYLVEESYKDSPEKAMVTYAFIETDDKTLKGIDVIYPGENLDHLYVQSSEAKEKLENDYKTEINRLDPFVGMTADEVKNSTWGNPKKINRTTNKYGVSEQWVYGGGKYIYVDEGIVTSIQE